MSGVRLWTETPGGLQGVKTWRTPGCMIEIREMNPTRYVLQWPGRSGIGETVTREQPEYSRFISAATAAQRFHVELVEFARSILRN